MIPNETLTPIRFHFYSLKFTPYKSVSDSTNSNTILRDIINYLTVQKQEGQGHLIDRNSDRTLEGPRELFMNTAVFMHKERRIRCSIALLRVGRTPMLKPVDKFRLIPLGTIGTIAEQTHFFIDFSTDKAILCVEFNNYGPRISDIEYYFRNVARDTLKLSKVTEVSLYMDTSIDKTLADFRNTLNMDIKIQPRKLASMDTDLVGKYFTGMNSIGNLLNPNFLKIEALFQTPGKGVKSAQLNNKANNMFLELLRRFKLNPQNIDCFENFTVRYEDKNGQEEVFNLLRGKKEVLKEVNLTEITKERHWYELIDVEFNEFMESL